MRNKICAFIIAALMIFACNASAEQTGETLRLSYYNELDTAALTELSETYMHSHPNIVIELEQVPVSSYFQKLESQAMGSLMPDVFVMHPSRIMDFISGGALLKLSGEEVNTSRYPAAALETYIYNGTCYGIPKDVETVALVYNKSMFDRAGVPYPDGTWDWQRLREAAIALTDHDSGIWGFYAPNDGPNGYYNLIYQNGGCVVDGGQSGYALAETQQAVKLWADFTLVDKVSPPVDYEGDDGNMFKDGYVAMQLVPAGLVAEYDKSSAIHGLIGIAPVPTLGERTQILETTAFVAAANTRHKDAVKQFLKYLSGDQAAKIMGETMAQLPADTLARARYLDVNDRFGLSVYQDALVGATPFPVSPMRTKWVGMETDVLNRIMSGAVSALNGLSELTNYINTP